MADLPDSALAARARSMIETPRTRADRLLSLIYDEHYKGRPVYDTLIQDFKSAYGAPDAQALIDTTVGLALQDAGRSAGRSASSATPAHPITAPPASPGAARARSSALIGGLALLALLLAAGCVIAVVASGAANSWLNQVWPAAAPTASATAVIAAQATAPVPTRSAPTQTPSPAPLPSPTPEATPMPQPSATPLAKPSPAAPQPAIAATRSPAPALSPEQQAALDLLRAVDAELNRLFARARALLAQSQANPALASDPDWQRQMSDTQAAIQAQYQRLQALQAAAGQPAPTEPPVVAAAVAAPPAGGSALGSIRGSAYEDRNQNGQRDPGERELYGMWYKITAGGDWHVCGYVGDDGTFGVPVSAGYYEILPVAPPGYRATQSRLKVIVHAGQASLENNIGFVVDPSAPGDVCNQFEPVRP